MRRFASVFRSKHSDRSDSNHALSIVPPVLSPASDHRSSGSSTASSLRTPEDIPSRTTPRSPWLSWLGAKKHKPWQQPQQTHTNVVSTQSHETEDDSADDSDHDSVSPSESTTAIPPIPVHNLTSKPILHSLSPSPFHHLTGTLFPRSCNHPRSLPPPHTMRSAMLKSHLYRCIQSGLTPPDNFPIMSLQSSTPQSDLDDPAITDPLQLTPISHGLRRWISRPCFEDRSVVWVHVLGSDEVICQRVTGSSLGVAELEYSDAIDSLAGYTGDSLEPLSQSELPQVVLVPHEDTREPEPEPEPNGSLSVSSHARNAPYKATPSPLRMQYEPPSTPSSPALSTAAPNSSQPVVSSSKRGVRFVEDDKEDQIPLGYVLRIKKKREEKARFLRDQQERRAFEVEKARMEQERLKRDQERAEWDKEKKAWEREKRAIEEEKKAKLYADEVAAARLRRESQRIGMGKTSTSAPPSMREIESSFKPDSRRYTRPLYDSQQPRRLASEPNVQTSTKNPSPHSGSTSSSRPPSITGHSPTSGSQSSSIAHSRPPSTYSAHTSSMEDVRGAGASKKGRRPSMASISSWRPSGTDRVSSYGFIPSVPPVPVFAMDMPLLPPTPPFMMHQYPRQRSHHTGSAESSASSLPQRAPGNHSLEHVLSHSSPSSSRKPVHHRHSSGDTRPSGTWSASGKDSHDFKHQQPQMPHSHSQPSSYSRGRQAQPLHTAPLQDPSPWTALPTTSQLRDRAPTNSSRRGPHANRRQSVMS